PAPVPRRIGLLSLHDALPISYGTVQDVGGGPYGYVQSGQSLADGQLHQIVLVRENHPGALPGSPSVGTVILYVDGRPSELLPSSDRKSTRLNSSHLGTSYAVF